MILLVRPVNQDISIKPGNNKAKVIYPVRLIQLSIYPDNLKTIGDFSNLFRLSTAPLRRSVDIGGALVALEFNICPKVTATIVFVVNFLHIFVDKSTSVIILPVFSPQAVEFR